ncbi:MAG: hypothetical protein ONB16_03120 [candidate division KSB1 bacterium]|nr:hypothetical protein [candidate division KSB1 bacterium]MDZ7318978.1 hypothetical protein [candidate division KSB1 bacterium]MDZ7340984.1 hypothetical protein [candidate division KSB1 bacterium]
MRQCEHATAVVEYFFNEMLPVQRAMFEDHLTHCARCQENLQALKITEQALNKYRRPAPDRKLLDDYHRQLAQTFQPSVHDRKRFWERVIERVLLQPSLTWRLAEAVVILVVGIFLGRIFFGQPADFTASNGYVRLGASLSVEPSLLQNYLQETEMVLLDVDNLDPVADQMVIHNLIQSAKYKYLVQKTILLKEQAQESDDQRMIELLNQVELILLELCNIETPADIETFIQIQQQLKNNYLLMQIKSLKQQAI